MTNKCIVCKRRGRPGECLSFHRFPNEVDKKSKWLKALKMDNADKWHYVCSKHFQKSDYDLTKTNSRVLNKNAVPSLSSTSHRQFRIKTKKINRPLENTPKQPMFIQIEAVPELPTNSLLSNQNIVYLNDASSFRIKRENIVTPQENIPKMPPLVKIGTDAELPTDFQSPNQNIIYLNSTSRLAMAPNAASAETRPVPKLVMIPSVIAQENQSNFPKIVNVETIKNAPVNLARNRQNKYVMEIPRDLGIVKDVPAVGIIPYEEFKSENDTSSDSASTDTASETRDLVIPSSVTSPTHCPSTEVETIQILFETSDSSTDSTEDVTMPTPLDLAELNSLGPGIKQETCSSSLIGFSSLRQERINKSSSSAQMRPDLIKPKINKEVTPIQPKNQIWFNQLKQEDETHQTISATRPYSDSSTDTASEGEDVTRVPPLDPAEPNWLRPEIKQERSSSLSPTLNPLGREINQPIPFLSGAQIRLNSRIQEIKKEATPSQSTGLKSQNPLTQQGQRVETFSAESMSEEQFIELLESESTVLTPELLFCKGVRKTRKRYFGDITLDDFQTPEDKEDFINTKKRICEDQRKIKSLSQVNRRLRRKLAKLNSVVSIVAGVCDVSHIKKVLEGEDDSEESSNDSVSIIDENRREEEINNDQTSNACDPKDYEENETQIDSFDLANQVQVTFLPGSDTVSVDRLKMEFKKMARQDISKSKKIKQLNNTIFMKNKIIENLKSELNKVTSVI